MQRLSGLDALFLYIETPSMHTHVMLTAVLDPSTAPDGYSFEHIRDHIAERVHLVAPFRRRPVEVPLRIHHPVWVDDAEFRIENHIKRHVLRHRAGSPAGLDELADFVGRTASRPLDRSRPLWEMWVVEGLDGDKIALVAKIHHSAMDGGSGVELMPSFFDLEPDPAPRPPGPKWDPVPAPNRWEMIGEAGYEKLRCLTGLGPLIQRTGSALDTIRRSRRGSGEPPGGTPLTAPRTCLNGPITGSRSVALTDLPLDEIKRIRRAFGATVNDVVLAICAGALRMYLDGHGSLPDQPLVAACPVSTRSDTNRGETGNHLSAMFTPLHTDLASAEQRLEATTATARSAKREHEAIGPDTLTQWAELGDPLTLPTIVGLYSRADLAGLHRPTINLILSNIAGPPFPVYMAGCQMESAFPMGPVIEGAGLNITVLSYRDSVFFGLIAATSLIPDIDVMRDALRASFDELVEATAVRESAFL